MKLSTRLTIAMVALVLITALAMGSLIYHNVAAVAMPRVLERIDVHAQFLALGLESSHRGARNFVEGFRSAAAMEGMMRARAAGGVDPEDGVTEAVWRNRMASRYLADLSARPDYLQIRLIGAEGRELVRVDRSGPGGAPRIVPPAELQDKGHTNYFKQTIGLAVGQAYVSPVGYNREHEVIESPPVPVVRIAESWHMADGRPFGIMLVTIDLRATFDRIRSSPLRGADAYVVNDRGDYLVNPDRDKEFGFEFGKPRRVQEDFPDVAGILPAADVKPRVMRDRAGGRFGAAIRSVNLAGGPRLTVIETMPYDVALIAAKTVRDLTLIGGAIATMVALLLGAAVARSLTRPLTQMTAAVTAFGRNEPMSVPTDASGEISILARAFAGMASDVRSKTAELSREIEERKLAEDKFRMAIDASPSGQIMIDGNGAIVLVNAEIERVFGYTREELIGQPVEILVPPDQRGSHAQHRTAYVAAPTARRMGVGRDLRGVRKDGTQFPVEVGLNPINTPSGPMVLGMIVDISERKRAEAELRDYAEREQLFIAAVESSDDAIVTKTLDGIITGWNPGAERLFGYSADEAIGQSINIIVPEPLHGEVRRLLERLRQGQKINHHETVRISKDGRPIHVSLSISPVRSASGEIIGSAKVARDITDQKKAAADLLDSERLARGIIDTSLDAFVQMDEAGRIIDWNAQAQSLFGWSRDEAIGQILADLVVPERYRQRHRDGLARFLASGKSEILGKRIELDALRRDGSEVEVELSVTALRQRGGHAFNGFIRDLTAQRAAEDQLRQAQKMEAVGQLTGGIAHDFNNMLTVITGTIDILANGVADRPQLAGIVKLIGEAADRGAELTSQLLAFSRKQPLQPRETDINALILEAAKMMRPTLGAQIEIESFLEDGAWPTLVDPTQLTTAVVNLGLNARDAMPDGGTLTLETSNVVLDEHYAAANRDVQPGDYVMIAVSDTGTGIPEVIIDKVFEPFFSTKEVSKGTGLGLSMVYGFVKQSGGHIKLYSEEGHGTTIKLYLPRVVRSADRLAVSVPAGPIERGHETILIVEDDAMVRKYVTTEVQSLGYATLAAANAAEALALIDGGADFDLLFTDMIMPGKMNGRQLAEEAAKRRPQLRVLFTSGYTENAIIHNGQLDSGVLLLAKPYRKTDLARMLRSALGGAQDAPQRDQPQRRAAS
jgi:PAS domain S-box-containing protein